MVGTLSTSACDALADRRKEEEERGAQTNNGGVVRSYAAIDQPAGRHASLRQPGPPCTDIKPGALRRTGRIAGAGPGCWSCLLVGPRPLLAKSGAGGDNATVPTTDTWSFGPLET